MQGNRVSIPIQEWLWDLAELNTGTARCVHVSTILDKCGSDLVLDGSWVSESWTLPLDGLFDTNIELRVQTFQKTEGLQYFSSALAKQLPLLILLIIALPIWFTANLLKRFFKPLAQLRIATSKITAGEYDYRTNIASRDEFGTLGNAFNDMAEKVGGSFSTLRSLSEIDHLILTSKDIKPIAEVVLANLEQDTRVYRRPAVTR